VLGMARRKFQDRLVLWPHLVMRSRFSFVSYLFLYRLVFPLVACISMNIVMKTVPVRLASYLCVM